MIEKNEILAFARDLSLNPDTVEKDYALSWLLFGINNNKATREWVFKGGTSLKKCFFETFRFSEDLDFTLRDNSQLDADFLLSEFISITENLRNEIGIEFFPDQFRFKVIDKGNGNFSAQGKIHYNGPLNRKHGVASIKLDLTTDEILVLKPVSRRVFHPYSDEPGQGIHANCYAFEEVVAEKIRALAQRIRPRDLYDVIHFFRNREMINKPQLVYDVLGKKCDYKDIAIPTFQYIEDHEKLDELEPQWENMLAHQLPALPPMQSFWADLEPFLDWLIGTLRVQELTGSEVVKGEIFQVGRVGGVSSSDTNLNRIQFAAANRVCINLRYHGKSRTIEPLSFRRNTATGNRLFYGYEREAGHVKAYSISKFQLVEVTNQPYTEKYPVEISSTGTISMPPLRRNTLPAGTRSSASRTRNRGFGSTSFFNRPGQTYKIKCPICQKTFSRNGMRDNKLNRHKTKYGTPCSGTVGYFV